MKRIMKNTKIINDNSQLLNLKLNENTTTPCVSKCNEPRCGLCKSITEELCLKLKKNFSCEKDNMNSTVRNCLYVLICYGFNEYYIGRTGAS